MTAGAGGLSVVKAPPAAGPGDGVAGAPLAGTLEVVATAADGTERVVGPDADPPQPGETLRVRGVLAGGESARLFLAYVTRGPAGATAQPIAPADFSAWPAAAPAATVASPAGTVDPGPTTETILLLGRRSPVPAGLDLARLLAGFPQPNLHRRASPTRSLTFGGPAPPAADADAAAAWVEANLRPHFELVRVVTFATAVAPPGSD